MSYIRSFGSFTKTLILLIYIYRGCGQLLCSVLALWAVLVRYPEVPHRTTGVMLGGDTSGNLVLLQSTAPMWTGGRWRKVCLNRVEPLLNELSTTCTFSTSNRSCWVFIVTLQSLDPSNENSVLWNAMIHPLVNMTIKGAIWYQGESASTGHMWIIASSIPCSCKRSSGLQVKRM